MLQLLAGNVMAMLKKKDEERAAEERSCQEAKQESFAENGATADSSKGTSSQQCRLDPPLSETKSKKSLRAENGFLVQAMWRLKKSFFPHLPGEGC